jgi:hypothetical protein
MIIEPEYCRIERITALSFAVENVGETIDRAFFHWSSFNRVSPWSKGPSKPSIR